ncbi:hypothetical protein PCL_06348 [Purpureocillium lilacinum]|uniref:Uncharacterized protein n=1 Tax=Purpureocillium lilacinum TaxID=33203 RepID=A0A2U3EML6_PURLI|nr:hypothetical protein PCL_06348 [Purpureocillium lilacinum]
MSNNSSSPPHDDRTNSTAIPAFTPSRVQSILTSRNQHPPPFLSLFYLNTATIYCAAITDSLDAMQTQVLPSRALTDDEIGALADHMGATTSIVLASRPAILATTLLLAWRGRATFRFPFWQPKWVKTSQDVFPSIAQPWLRDEKTARLAWHASRVVTYGVLCYLAVPFPLVTYAHVRGTQGIASDPRLQEIFAESVQYKEEMKKLRLR